MNDLDVCLAVVSRSCQPLRDIRRWISRRPSDIEAWFQRTTNRKWHISHQSHVTDDVTWPRRCCEAVRSAILATTWLLVFIFFILFSARKHYSALYAIARPSVRPSVRLSHGWISQKRLKLGLWNFHHTVAPYTSVFLQGKFRPEIPTGSPERGDQQWRGRKTSHFLDLHSSILKTVRDTSKVTIND